MNEDIKEMYEECIKEQIDNLDTLDQGSEEYTRAVNSINTMTQTLNSESKNATEIEAKDNELKHKKIHDWVMVGVTVATTCLSMWFYDHENKKNWDAEASGVYASSNNTRNLNSGLRRFLK